VVTRIADFQFQKRGELIIRTRNEPLSVAGMCVSNPDGSPFGIHGCDTAPTPTGFAQIASDDFPILHSRQFTGNRIETHEQCAATSVQPIARLCSAVSFSESNSAMPAPSIARVPAMRPI
jgi:hypothetical protein